MISIVILAHNELDLLKDCLQSIFDHVGDLRHEIIVVDNGSTDETAEYVRFTYRDINVIRNEKNLGVAVARNQGVKASQGRFVVFLDCDARLTKGSLMKMYEYLASHHVVDLVGPKLIYPDGRTQESPRAFPTVMAVLIRGLGLEKNFTQNKWTYRYLMKDYRHDGAKSVDWVLGACQMIKKPVFAKIGLLDEKYFFGYEDIEFCRRIKQNGGKVVYLPQAEIIHDYQRKSTGFNMHKWEHVKSILRYFLTH